MGDEIIEKIIEDYIFLKEETFWPTKIKNSYIYTLNFQPPNQKELLIEELFKQINSRLWFNHKDEWGPYFKNKKPGENPTMSFFYEDIADNLPEGFKEEYTAYLDSLKKNNGEEIDTSPLIKDFEPKKKTIIKDKDSEPEKPKGSLEQRIISAHKNKELEPENEKLFKKFKYEWAEKNVKKGTNTKTNYEEFIIYVTKILNEHKTKETETDDMQKTGEIVSIETDKRIENQEQDLKRPNFLSKLYQGLKSNISKKVKNIKKNIREINHEIDMYTNRMKIVSKYQKKDRPKRQIPYKAMFSASFLATIGLISYLTYQHFENKTPNGRIIIDEKPSEKYIPLIDLDAKPQETPIIQETKPRYLNGIEIKNETLNLEQMVEQGRKYGLTGIYASITDKRLSEIKPENYNNGINRLAEVAGVKLFEDGEINDLLTVKDIKKIYSAYRNNIASKTVLLVPDSGDGNNNLSARDYVHIGNTYNNSTRTGIDTIAQNYDLSKDQAKKAVLESKNYANVDSIKFTKQLGKHLSVSDSIEIINAYYNNTNKNALKIIKDKLDLNCNDIYALVDPATQILKKAGLTEQEKIRKMERNYDIIVQEYVPI